MGTKKTCVVCESPLRWTADDRMVCGSGHSQAGSVAPENRAPAGVLASPEAFDRSKGKPDGD